MSISIGRNDPCHCGSGKKYKKCCLEADTYKDLEQYKAEQTKQKMIHDHYGILSHEDLLDSIDSQMEWTTAEYENIAVMIAHSMHHEYEPKVVFEAIAFWNQYANETNPTIRKMEVMCAAIEYMIIEAYGFEGTQSELAAKYNVSAGAISKRFQEILNYTEDNELDEELPWDDDDFDHSDEGAQYFQTVLPDLHKAVEKERRKLDPILFKEVNGHFWLMHETRPYLRALFSYAEALFLNGDTEKAIGHLEEILKLNTMDNLGARYYLHSAYLEASKIEEAEALLQDYKDDASAVFAYNRIVQEYLKNGITPALKMQYRVAKNQNSYVPDYLLGKTTFPDELPDFIGIGDENEAIDYIAYHARLWASQPELCQWLGIQE